MAKKRERGGTSPKVPTLKIVQSNSEATPVSQDSPPPQQDSVGGSPPEDSVGGQHNHSLYREGRKALERINTGRDYTDWVKVAAALDTARTEAMNKAGVNQPIGRPYNKAFGEILKRERLGTDKLDSATRNQLFDLYKHRSSIEEWRAKLDPVLRSKLNHPSSVLRNWSKTEEGRRALGKSKGKGGERGGNRRRNTAAQLKERVEQVEQLKARIKEVEEERDQHKREASPEFKEPAVAITTLVSAGYSLQAKDLPKEVRASDLRDLADRIGRLAAEVEAARAEETVH